MGLTGWAILVLKYYSKERAKTISNEFKQKTIQSPNVWNAITIISIIVPLICIAFLLKK